VFEKVMYPSLNAKMKGMYAKTLSKDDLEDLMKQNRIKDAIVVLKSKLEALEDLDVEARRIEIEAKLDDIILDDIEKIYRHLDNETKEIFDAYILKFKLKTLRIIWRELQANNEPSSLNFQSRLVKFF
jgi:vacuolar-type H+-ATPase subunit C/Vma6